MRVAIFHDYIENAGGAERVVLTLAKQFDLQLFSDKITKQFSKVIE